MKTDISRENGPHCRKLSEFLIDILFDHDYIFDSMSLQIIATSEVSMCTDILTNFCVPP